MMKKITILMFGFMSMLTIFAGCSASAATTVPIETKTATKSIILLDDESQTITTGGNYKITGTITDGQLLVDTEEAVTLSLEGVNITNKNGAALQITNAKEITISLLENTTNTLTDGGTSDFNATIFSNDTLVFDGLGSLVITGNQAHGIESDDDIIINNGTITITALKDSIHAKDNITINGGMVNITDSNEGIESNNDIIINNGTLDIKCSDDALNAATDITINDGMIYAKSKSGDAIDSNGTINIKDGTIVAIGANGPEGGIDCDRNNLNITGGTVLATGGTNSIPTETSESQNSVLLGRASANSILHIDGESGSILTFKSDIDYQNMLFSSSLLETDKTYTLYTGGVIGDGSDFHGLYTDASYINGIKGDSFMVSGVITTKGGTSGMDGKMGDGIGKRQHLEGEIPPQDGTIPQEELPAGQMPKINKESQT